MVLPGAARAATSSADIDKLVAGTCKVASLKFVESSQAFSSSVGIQDADPFFRNHMRITFNPGRGAFMYAVWGVKKALPANVINSINEESKIEIQAQATKLTSNGVTTRSVVAALVFNGPVVYGSYDLDPAKLTIQCS